MQRETIHLEIVTPCFLGGTQGTAEWRAASIRGHLRWWFRAVAGAAFRGDLEKVRAAEDLLFGSTERGSLLRIRTFETPAAVAGGGHCTFGPALTSEEIASLWGVRDDATLRRLRLAPDSSRPIHYLGFGPIVGNQLRRPYLPAEKQVSMDLLWMREPPKDLGRLFDQALWAWLHLGGIGGRSRRGFGSLQRTPVPVDRTDFTEQARALLQLGAGRPAGSRRNGPVSTPNRGSSLLATPAEAGPRP